MNHVSYGVLVLSQIIFKNHNYYNTIDKYWYTYFIDEENMAQRGEMFCPVRTSQKVMETVFILKSTLYCTDKDG